MLGCGRTRARTRLRPRRRPPPPVTEGDHAVPLGTIASAYPHRSSSVQLPVDVTVQYKYVKRSPTGVLTWESTPNRTLTVSQDPPGTDDRWNVTP
ncbi:carbohydrate-binding module family 20 domain-containing protein [Streptomyces sp. NPDC014991]|uniref:carbohydrate-binding module family 20 domain-containing protein n=1 Tax=Streptomyces sp. NPDC014991 TaxID=3364935 RepID=UPI0036FD2806